MNQRTQASAWVGNLLLLAASCLVALGVGEVVIRALAPQEIAAEPQDVQPKGFYAAHPPLEFTMNPAFRGRFRRPEFDTQIAIDSLGIRDRERGPRGPGVRRILVLGDSYTFGWGVEADERYTARLERRLNEGAVAGGKRWEVIPAGISAYGTREELEWLRAIGWSLEPDLVVLQFCMGNDFADNVGPRHHVEKEFLVTDRPAGERERPASLAARARRWLFAHSELAAFVRDRVSWARRGGSRVDRIANDLRQFDRTVDAGLPRTRELLAELAADARTRGVPFTMMIVPMRHQVYEYAGAGANVVEYPNRALESACDSLAIPVVDLLPAFRAATALPGPRLYFRSDRHWTVAGHRVAGDTLFRALTPRLAALSERR